MDYRQPYDSRTLEHSGKYQKLFLQVWVRFWNGVEHLGLCIASTCGHLFQCIEADEGYNIAQ